VRYLLSLNKEIIKILLVLVNYPKILYIRRDIIIFLINANCENIINTLIKILNDNEEDDLFKLDVAKELFSLNLKDTQISLIVKMFFEDKKYFLERISRFSILFNIHSLKYNILKEIVEKAFIQEKPIYLKNNKLHTIEDGKVINTISDIDTKELQNHIDKFHNDCFL
jgi:hypothetical protein